MAIRRRWVAYSGAVYKTEKKVCGIGETAVLLHHCHYYDYDHAGTVLTDPNKY